MHRNQEARREVRRMLANKVKSNWTFDPEFDGESTSEHQQQALRTTEPECKIDGEVSQWRERYYGSSLSSSSSSIACTIEEYSSGSGSDSDSQICRMTLSSSSPPSSDQTLCGESTVVGKVSKKRKRMLQEEEEAYWNKGLALWRARRDAWTGAVKIIRGSDSVGGWDDAQTCTMDQSHGTSIESVKTCGSEDEDDGDEGRDHDRLSGNSASLDSGSTQVSHTSAENVTTLVPVSKPLVSPTNPIRAAITPALYTDIYNTVVISGRSPTIPINLADMTKALVKGWRDNGKWPPKPGACAIEAPITKRKNAAVVRSIASGGKHAHLKKGVESVRKVFGLGHGQAHHAVV